MQQRTKTTRQITLALIAICAAAALRPPIAAARGPRVRQALVATGVEADARGRVRVDIRDRPKTLEGRLEVRAGRLDARSVFDVTVDGVRIGSFTTGRAGAGKARFDTRPRGNDQLLGVDPRGRTVAVVNGDGATVLEAAVAAGALDDDVRCCLPDDSGPECEDRTAAECAAAGGIDLGPGSCLPNPCAGAPPAPDQDIRCCLPDDSGPECEDRTA